LSTFGLGNRIIKIGKAIKEIRIAILTPILIISPKSITGRILLIVSEANAAIVVIVVKQHGLIICSRVCLIKLLSSASGLFELVLYIGPPNEL